MHYSVQHDDLTTDAENVGTILLWLGAVLVEQAVATMSSIFLEELPFCAEYCGERMQAWLMLSFGESVIALLYNAHDYTAGTVRTFAYLSF